MTKKILVAAAVAFALLVPASAEAQTTIIWPNGEVAEPYQRWIDHSVMPTYDGTVLLTDDTSECDLDLSGVEGCARIDPLPWIVVDPARFGESAAEYRLDKRWVTFHELGHIFDFTVMTDAEREEFERINRYPGEWEISPDPTAPFEGEPPREMFADAYANCSIDHHPEFAAARGGARYFPSVSVYGNLSESWVPVRWQYKRTCALISRAAAAARDLSSTPAPN